MGKNKLKKFAEMETLPCVYQYPFAHLKETGGCPLRAALGRGGVSQQCASDA